MISRNDILLDQTLVCEASRIFSKNPQPTLSPFELKCNGSIPLSLDRILQLSMLLDGLALHENLYVLDGELPEDSSSLILRNILLEEGYLRKLKTIPYEENITTEMREFLKINLEHCRWSGDSWGLDLRDNYLQAVTDSISSFLGNSSNILSASDLQRATISSLKQLNENSHLIYAGDDKKVNLLRDDPVSFLGQSIIKGFGHQPTGGNPSTWGAPILRTFLYWRVSEHAEIALYTSPRRMGELGLLTKQLQKRVEREITNALTKKFETEIETAYPQNIPLILPSTLALFLDIYRNSDLKTSIIQFRQIFQKTRNLFRNLEEELSSVATIGERIKIQERIKKGLSYINTTLDGKNDSYLESALNYAPEILKPLSNPLDPSKYSASLISQPINWIRKWWVSRPFKHVCQISKRLLIIKDYKELINHTLGIKISEPEYDSLVNSYVNYLNLRGPGNDKL